jgi:putative RNA 2'-phosphotransferase
MSKNLELTSKFLSLVLRHRPEIIGLDLDEARWTSVESIKSKGLVTESSQHVHLSSDIETAAKVGQRHGKPTVLVVKALQMHESGYSFYLSDNGVWLTESVPITFINF